MFVICFRFGAKWNKCVFVFHPFGPIICQRCVIQAIWKYNFSYSNISCHVRLLCRLLPAYRPVIAKRYQCVCFFNNSLWYWPCDDYAACVYVVGMDFVMFYFFAKWHFQHIFFFWGSLYRVWIHWLEIKWCFVLELNFWKIFFREGIGFYWKRF